MMDPVCRPNLGRGVAAGGGASISIPPAAVPRGRHCGTRHGPAPHGPVLASHPSHTPHTPPSPPPPPALGLSIPGGAGRDTAWERGEPGVGGGGGAASLPAPGAGGSRAVLLGRRAVMKSLY